MTKAQKIKELHAIRDEAIKKLEELYKNFRGVHHEDSASEIKYTQIKVMESFITSLDEEIKSLENHENEKTASN